MLITLIVFMWGVFLGGFAAAFFDFGIKIQFVTGKSALPEYRGVDTHKPWNPPK